MIQSVWLSWISIEVRTSDLVSALCSFIPIGLCPLPSWACTFITVFRIVNGLTATCKLSAKDSNTGQLDVFVLGFDADLKWFIGPGNSPAGMSGPLVVRGGPGTLYRAREEIHKGVTCRSWL